MQGFKKYWLKVPKGIRLLLVFAIGWLVVIAGIVMLVTPGPGWAAIFLGFAILATEFAHAARVRDFLVRVLKAIIDWLRSLFVKKPKR